MDPRLERLLRGPILSTLARLSGPNIAVAIATTMTTIADAWFVGQIGVTALASLALVYPVQALLMMMSAGAMGGGVSSAVSRALGGGQRERANAIVLHAVIIALGMSALFVLLLAVQAPAVFTMLGGSAGVLDGAVAYAEVAFGGAIAMWLANTFASILRGTGNMNVPAIALVFASAVQIFLSGALTLGWGPFPEFGIQGPAMALTVAYALAACIMGGYVISARSGLRVHLSGVALKAEIFMDIIKVGGVACGNATLTIATILILTRLVAEQGAGALAGFGLGSRLELMLIPVAFGIGGAMTASVGANFGAKQYARARRIAWIGGLTVGGFTSLIGIAVAIWPELWLSHFTANSAAIAVGRNYLAIVGPFYGFFAMGMALYFASQGTGNMKWPFTAGTLRLIIAAGGATIVANYYSGDLNVMFACIAAGLICFGSLIAWSLFSRVWNPDRST
jgi:putative MATE family efflux protein